MGWFLCTLCEEYLGVEKSLWDFISWPFPLVSFIVSIVKGIDVCHMQWSFHFICTKFLCKQHMKYEQTFHLMLSNKMKDKSVHWNLLKVHNFKKYTLKCFSFIKRALLKKINAFAAESETLSALKASIFQVLFQHWKWNAFYLISPYFSRFFSTTVKMLQNSNLGRKRWIF